MPLDSVSHRNQEENRGADKHRRIQCGFCHLHPFVEVKCCAGDRDLRNAIDQQKSGDDDNDTDRDPQQWLGSGDEF